MQLNQQRSNENIFPLNVNMSLPVLSFAEPTFDPSIANCNFESGFCHYTQEKEMGSSWRIVSVKPNIFRNGDHTTGAGGSIATHLGFCKTSISNF